jgi:hypothetical protein
MRSAVSISLLAMSVPVWKRSRELNCVLECTMKNKKLMRTARTKIRNKKKKSDGDRLGK